MERTAEFPLIQKDLWRVSSELVKVLEDRPLVPGKAISVFTNGYVNLRAVLEATGYLPEIKPKFYVFYNADGIITLVPVELVVRLAQNKH